MTEKHLIKKQEKNKLENMKTYRILTNYESIKTYLVEANTKEKALNFFSERSWIDEEMCIDEEITYNSVVSIEDVSQ